MAFQIKNFPSITASMVNRMRATTTKITDFSVGSVARTIVEAPANELDQLYQQVFNGLLEAIPVATYNTFNFQPLPATAANGPITVTITAQATDTDIPAGTILQYPGGSVTYSTAVDATIPATQTTVNVIAGASQTGPVGNIPPGVNFTPSPAIPNFVSAVNDAAFINGRDVETDAQRQQRFQQFILSLARSNVAGIIYGCGTAELTDSNGAITEQVVTASVDEPWTHDSTQPIGLVNVYVHNGTTGASGPLLSLVLNILYGYVDSNGNKVPGYKAAGVKVLVNAATSTVLNVTGTVTALPGYDETSLASQGTVAVTNYILSLGIEDTFECSQAVFLVKSIKGVGNFVMSTPTVDQTTDYAHKLMPGTIAIT